MNYDIEYDALGLGKSSICQGIPKEVLVAMLRAIVDVIENKSEDDAINITIKVKSK